jgi:hypothetical protein
MPCRMSSSEWQPSRVMWADKRRAGRVPVAQRHNVSVLRLRTGLDLDNRWNPTRVQVLLVFRRVGESCYVAGHGIGSNQIHTAHACGDYLSQADHSTNCGFGRPVRLFGRLSIGKGATIAEPLPSMCDTSALESVRQPDGCNQLQHDQTASLAQGLHDVDTACHPHTRKQCRRIGLDRLPWLRLLVVLLWSADFLGTTNLLVVPQIWKLCSRELQRSVTWILFASSRSSTCDTPVFAVIAVKECPGYREWP